MAQWIRRLSPEEEIPGSSPGGCNHEIFEVLDNIRILGALRYAQVLDLIRDVQGPVFNSFKAGILQFL